MIKIYTDGSCLENPGNGGWAAIIIDDTKKTEIKGSIYVLESNYIGIPISWYHILLLFFNNSKINCWSVYYV